ncbi:aspartic proteinase precursor [Microthyrium microscopicum]|uniref:Aspartic proteinase n=1 Tax=Microthyrium microscopicum TaxID=703497 RepID=A0A6A6U4P1_9PEZI|nr:aspartic proteinase precursor [Microthyrium microscopicum]
MIKNVRIPIKHNTHYKPSGPKSYVWLLRKYNFTPTLPGPYVRGSNKELLKSEAYKHHHSHKHGAAADQPATGSAPAPAQPSGTGSTTGTSVSADDQQNDSEYTVQVQIGTPAQTLPLDFDTGSSDLWVLSTELPSATQSSLTSSGHAIYNPAKSSTAKKSTGSTWQIQYGDSSSASGDVYTDNVTLGGLTIKNQAVEVASKVSTQFTTGPGSGLLGLAWGSINTVKPTAVATPVQNMITEDEIPQTAELFTAYLGSWRDTADADQGKSFYTFGYIDQDVLAANGNAQPSYTPVDNSQGFWQFASASMTVNGKTITQSGNTAIADTGTTLLLTADATCKAIYAAIPGSKYDSTQQGYLFPSSTTADQLPVVTFAVGDKQFAVQKEDLGFADAGNGMVYGGIQSRGDMDFDILGDTFLKSIYAIFDQGNTRFGAVQRNEATQNTAAPPSSS